MLKYIEVRKLDTKKLPAIDIDVSKIKVIHDNVIGDPCDSEKDLLLQKLILETYVNTDHYSFFFSNNDNYQYIETLHCFWKKIVVSPLRINGVDIVQYSMLNPKLDNICDYAKHLVKNKRCDKQLFHFLIERKEYAVGRGGNFLNYYKIIPQEETTDFSTFERLIYENINIASHFTLDIIGYTVDELVKDELFNHLCGHFRDIYLFFYNNKNAVLHIFS